MKKSKVIDVFKFLNSIKLNKISNKEIRSAIISNHMQMYNIVKQYEEDIKELHRKLFEDKQPELQALNKLREDYKKADANLKSEIESTIVKNYSDIISIEMDFNKEVSNILNVEVELNLKKVSQELFIDACVDSEVDIIANDLIILKDLFE